MTRLFFSGALVATCLVAPAGVSGESASTSDTDVLQFSSSDSLFESLTPNARKTACQPLRGDGAQLLELSQLAGTVVYRISVLSGRCKGETGWVGATRLERATATRAQ